MRIFIFCFIILAATTVFAQQDERKENLDVFHDLIKWNNPGSFSIDFLVNQTDKYYKERNEQIARLKTKSDWLKRQETVRKKLDKLLGTLPAKGALEPEVSGVVHKEGYRIEKIIFQPIPGYYETGALYIPDNLKGKAPAILNVIGHDQISFREQYYQVIITNLLKKGMIVFAIDPPGQGEHVQYYDSALKFSAVGYSVLEHAYFGNVCFLTGANPAKYFIWDAMRAIDYLITRPEVDPERIGATGFSGGGTVSAYVAAYDDRVKVVVPCSWPIAYQALIQTKGVQDAETIFIGGLAEGITYEDLIEVRAPKPTLMSFTSRDEYLVLQGARDALREAKNAYKAFGKENNVQLVEDDDKHSMTPKIRLKIYDFFQEHFNLPGDSAEDKLDLATEKELMVTPTGQIATYKGGKMIFDLNKEEANPLIKKLQESRQNINHHLATVTMKAKKISGYISPDSKNQEPFINGRYVRDGYKVELDVVPGENKEYAIPILLFTPDDNKQHPAIIYLHSKGKNANADPGGEIEKLVKKGYVVAAADVLGVGATKRTAGREYTDGNTAILIGRSMVGIQAGDIVRVSNYLKNQPGVNRNKIGAIAFNEICLALIHAAAFDTIINNVTLVSPLVSYKNVVMNRLYKIGNTKRPAGNYWHPVEVDFNWGVAAALTAYDLPDLIAAIAPRKVVMADIRNSMLEPACQDVINDELRFPRAVYSYKKAPDNLTIVGHPGDAVSFY
ncbi:MAG TPA: alpha/beta hydrolase family protein [Flavitalea sp.]|nr:alpha/beta hydrolase family protein [Flavitalea sp.]